MYLIGGDVGSDSAVQGDQYQYNVPPISIVHSGGYSDRAETTYSEHKNGFSVTRRPSPSTHPDTSLNKLPIRLF
jgi:hypothetical protein